MDESRCMIRSRGLTKTFQTGRGRMVHAVRHVDLEVFAGEIFGLLGPNGAGKTTLLRMLGTIISPTDGECFIDGLCARTDPQAVRHSIGFLSGNTKLYKRLTARELLFYFGRLHGLEDAHIARRIDELAGLLDMKAFLDRRCETFSTGQAQRVSIARVILHDPPVLILDEPTLGLDIMSSRTILDFILHARSRDHCIIFSTHYMTEAELLCDRIGFLYAGRIIAVGTQPDLFQQTGTTNLKDAFLFMADRQAQEEAA